MWGLPHQPPKGGSHEVANHLAWGGARAQPSVTPGRRPPTSPALKGLKRGNGRTFTPPKPAMPPFQGLRFLGCIPGVTLGSARAPPQARRFATSWLCPLRGFYGAIAPMTGWVVMLFHTLSATK